MCINPCVAGSVLSAVFVSSVAAAAFGQSVLIANQMPSDLQNGTVSGKNVTLGSARVADEFSIPATLRGGAGVETWGITRMRAVMLTTLAPVPASARFEMFANSRENLPSSTAPMHSFPAARARFLGLFQDALSIVEFEVGDGVTPLFFARTDDRVWLSLVGLGGAQGGDVAFFASHMDAGPPIGLPPAFLSADLGFPEWLPLRDADGVAPGSFAFSVEGRIVPGAGSAGLVCACAIGGAWRRRRV